MRDDDRRLLALLGQGHKLADRPPAPSGVHRLRTLGWLLAAMAAGLFAWTVLRGDGEPAPGLAQRSSEPPAQVRWWGNPSLGGEETLFAATPAEVSAPTAPAAQPAGGLFRLDEGGQLQLDERTRLGVESLVALNEPARLDLALQAHLAGLPSQAVAGARQLVQQYAGYADAQKRSYPAGTSPLVPEEGLAELDGLRALRASYFGHNEAQRLFGEEEAIARRLLELMRDDPVPHAPMEEKAERAQARFDQERSGGVIEDAQN